MYSPKIDLTTGLAIDIVPNRTVITHEANTSQITDIVLFNGDNKSEFEDWWNSVKHAWDKKEDEEWKKKLSEFEKMVESEYIHQAYSAKRKGEAIPDRIQIDPPNRPVTDADSFLNFVGTKLVGNALAWFQGEHFQYKNDVRAQPLNKVDRYNDFIKLIKETLGEKLNLYEKYHRIIMWKQRPEESIKQFATFIRQKFIHYGLPLTDIAWPIIMGSLEQYKKNAIIWKVDTLEQWIQKVEEAEADVVTAINRSIASKQKINNNSNSNNSNNNNNKSGNSTTQSEKKVYYCSQCGKRNHKGIDCFKNPVPKPPLPLVQEMRAKGETILISSKKSDSLICIPIRHEENHYIGLLDTGATHSLVDKRIVNKLKLPITEPTGEMNQLQSLAGEVKPIGSIKMKIQVGNQAYTGKFLVIDNLQKIASHFLIGEDIQSKCKVNIDRTHNSIKSGDDHIINLDQANKPFLKKENLKFVNKYPKNAITHSEMEMKINSSDEVETKKDMETTSIPDGNSRFSKVIETEPVRDTKIVEETGIQKEETVIEDKEVKQDDTIPTSLIKPHFGEEFKIQEQSDYAEEVKNIVKEQNLFISEEHWKDAIKKDWLPPPHEFKQTPLASASKKCPNDKKEQFLLITNKMRLISLTEKQLVHELLLRNHDIFVISELEEAGMAKIPPITIDIGDQQPIAVQPVRYSVKDKEDLKPVLDKLLRTKTIEKDDGPWSSNMVMVRRPGKEIRPCVGFHRTINKFTPPIYHPPPRIDDFIDWATGAVFIFIGDLCASYHQLLVHPAFRALLAFITPFGKFRYRALPMGLKNSQAYFQRGIESVLEGLLWKIVCSYIDDMMIRSSTIQGFLIHLQVVFNRLRERNMFLKISKCQVLPETVKCLGYMITPKGLAMDPEKISKVVNARDPKNTEEVHSFSGLTQFYKDFIKNYSKIMKPINALLAKDIPFKWEDEEKLAFKTIKEKITTAPILVQPKMEQPFIVKVDASKYAVGATLAQLDENNKERPIRFYSKMLLDAETRYPAHEREALAVVKAIKHFRTYLHNNQKITIYTDNMAVKHLFHPTAQHDTSVRIAKWLTIMQEFDYDIIHRAGKKNTDNDALSRSPIACVMTTRSKKKAQEAGASDIISDSSSAQKLQGDQQKEGDTSSDIKDTDNTRNLPKTESESNISLSNKEISSTATSTNTLPHTSQDTTTNSELEVTHIPVDIKQLQREDPECFRYIKYLEIKELPEDKYLSQQTVTACSQLQLDNDILYHAWWPQRSSSRQETRLQLVIPDTLKSTILEHYHDSQLGGHMGFNKTYDRIQRNYYWINMYKDVKNYIQSCPECQFSKKDKEKPMGLLQPIIPDRIMQQWCFDVHGPLPETTRGNKYIVLFVERFTGWPEGVAVPHQQSNLIGELLVKEIICRYGSFETLTSDKANNLVRSEVIQKLCTEFAINTRHTSAYHPEANGQVERYFQTIDQILKKFVSQHQKDWDLHLSFALAAIRFSLNETRQESPAFMMYGRDPNLPIDLSLPLPRLERENFEAVNHPQNMIRHTQEMSKLIKQNLEKSREKTKQKFDSQHQTNNLKIGELVLLTKLETQEGKSKKLDYIWKGPYRVTVINSETNVTITMIANPKKVEVVHVNRLKRYFSPIDLDKFENDSGSYDVDYILDDKIEDGVTYYKIHWKGYNKRHDSWVAEEDFNAPLILKKYKEGQTQIDQANPTATTNKKVKGKKNNKATKAKEAKEAKSDN